MNKRTNLTLLLPSLRVSNPPTGYNQKSQDGTETPRHTEGANGSY